jgi:hypothetical protein
MLYEITQIKKWLIKRFDLKSEGKGFDLRIIDPVPDGIYKIPIGFSNTPLKVQIKGGKITIK